MTRFLARRLGGSLIVLLGLSVITFLLARVVPSNAAAVFIGPKARPDDIARVTQQLGLDQPLPIQYLTYMLQMLTRRLGHRPSAPSGRSWTRSCPGCPRPWSSSSRRCSSPSRWASLLGILSARWPGQPARRGVRVLTLIGVVAAGVLPGAHPPGHLLPDARRAAAGRSRGLRTCASRRPSPRSPASSTRRRAAGPQRSRLLRRDVAPGAAGPDARPPTPSGSSRA